MRLPRKPAILCIALLVFGAARLPFEAGLASELRSAGLFPPQLEIGTRERIGQTSSAVALGGLRTLVATFLNLRAFSYFTEQRWSDVESTYNTIVDLAPRTRYYWESGSWHLAYNAASYYANDSKLPPLRRREAWRTSILKGRAFLERGIRNNPDDWSLLANLGMLLADPNKFPAFSDTNATFAGAADAYRKAYETGNARGYVRRSWFYALARIKGREAEALSHGLKLHAESTTNHTPTLLTLLLVLELHENPDLDPATRAIKWFGTPEKAYHAMTVHWRRTRERFPIHGVARAIESLEKQLNIPAEDSLLIKPLPPPSNPDDWFRD